MITVAKGSNIDRATAELGFKPGFITDHMLAHAEGFYPEAEAEARCLVAIEFLNSLPFAQFEEILDESWRSVFDLANRQGSIDGTLFPSAASPGDSVAA